MNNRNIPHLLGIVLLIGLFLPHTSTFLMLFNPLLCLALYTVRGKIVCASGIKNACTFVIIVVLTSMIVQLASSAETAETGKYLMSGTNIVLLLFCFPLAANSRIPNGYFYFAIMYILFSQLVYLFNIPFFQRFFEDLYPVTGEKTTNYFNYMRRNISIRNLFDWRLSGLYRNPNQAARFVTILTAVFLISNKNSPIKIIGRFVVLALFSILLTGSRTGLIILLLILVLSLHKSPSFKQSQRVLVYLFGFVLIVLMTISSLDISNIRGFQLAGGFSNSANEKWYVLMDYLSQPNSIYHILFGYADVSLWNPTNVDVMDKFDSEYGEIIFAYGFLGFLALLLFYIASFRHVSKYKRIFFINVLWIISSTLFMSYRASFVFMFSLSYIYMLPEEEQSIVQNI